MRILHAPVEIAGQAALSAFGERELGHVAHAFFPPHHFDYALGADLYLSSQGTWGRRVETLWKIPFFAAQYDVFHFHFGLSFLPGRFRNIDVRLLRGLGRKAFVQFWGSEARIFSVETQRNPYLVDPFPDSDEVRVERLKRWADILDGHVIVADHYFDLFLRPYFPHIHVVGQLVDTRRLLPSYPNPNSEEPVVVHAPSHKAAKGTPYVQKAVERLQAKGLRFRYIEVHGLKQSDALRLYAQGDIVVDQLCSGSHGVFAAEAMSMGKPVICYTLPELVSTYPEGFPIINANPETIEAVLEEWIQRPQDRYRRGVQSREYAERVHDCRVVATKLIEVYQAVK